MLQSSCKIIIRLPVWARPTALLGPQGVWQSGEELLQRILVCTCRPGNSNGAFGTNIALAALAQAP